MADEFYSMHLLLIGDQPAYADCSCTLCRIANENNE